MPFNQLLLPLLGGYLLVTFTHIFSYWCSRQSKEQLLFVAAVGGLVGLLVARLLALAVLATPWGEDIAAAVKTVAPYNGLGTAILAFLVCVGLRQWINWVWPKEDAALWLYGTATYPSLERLFIQSVLHAEDTNVTQSFPRELLTRMFFLRRVRQSWDNWTSTPEPEDESEAPERVGPWPLMLTMKDRKVYVGWVEFVPPLRAEPVGYIRMLLLWSGYRDAATLKVHPTDWYDGVLRSMAEEGLPENHAPPLIKLVQMSDISSASFYDHDIFGRFQKGGEKGDAPPTAGRRRRGPRPSSKKPDTA